MASKQPSPRIVVLKGDRLYGDLICEQIKGLWRHATVQVFQHGFDALEAIQADPPDLYVAGVKIDDMDGLEHLEPFIDSTLPILVLTSRKEARTFEMLRTVRYDGIYDGHAEGLENLPAALQQVIQRRLYVSPTMVEHLKRPKNITLDALTEKEQVVLSVIGDGSDDLQAAEKLGISPHTVNTHRKSIMAKLGLHHKGQLILSAIQRGYVWVTPNEIFYPGFQRQLQSIVDDTKAATAGPEQASA
ncbi:MAG TPA: response regulator transcription factor [Opitutaceae bacterium]|nr:response regulator transcription factor [Lacunisphaera sp.]HWA10425.1 response regulator transcription factor [Opitutaceae bacterium]